MPEKRPETDPWQVPVGESSPVADQRLLFRVVAKLPSVPRYVQSPPPVVSGIVLIEGGEATFPPKT